MNNTTSEVTTKTLANMTSPFIGNTSTCTTEGWNHDHSITVMVGLGAFFMGFLVCFALLTIVSLRCSRWIWAILPPDEEHQAHFTKGRALKAAQQHQPVIYSTKTRTEQNRLFGLKHVKLVIIYIHMQ
ncbi:hypothetical protein DPMN_053376 [Dreissena polymorpha]|uniref:Uncharacterized protein n=1 Tax=Dreissena polymorpha TaxID=45954 RepID=A0A9D4CMH5_DREPO|nr:hypothetical protein DPMN_053376 [Dreissena polymorpha]